MLELIGVRRHYGVDVRHVTISSNLGEIKRTMELRASLVIQRFVPVVARFIPESLRQKPADLWKAENIPSVTLSISIAQYKSGETIEQTLRRADSALYLAKNAGRNRVAVDAG